VTSAVAAFRPDVALIDIGLPGIDGYRLAGLLRHTRLIAGA
jgi:DNA-binding response OmpR family regulator